MRRASTFAEKVEIFIAGDISLIEAACQDYCKMGLCVTVTPTKYIYTGGNETGAVIGLINYARFPALDADELWEKAVALGQKIMIEASQQSFTVQNSEFSACYSVRPDHIEPEFITCSI